MEVTTTAGRLQRLMTGATSSSRFGGAFEEAARAAGAVACFVRFSMSTTTALSAVGYVLVPVILWIEVAYAPSLAFQLGVYLPITALASWACHLVRIGKAYVDDQSAVSCRTRSWRDFWR
jgi:hypothetical protein